MNEIIDKISAWLGAKLPFVAYGLPNSSHVVVYLQSTENLRRVVDFSENGFVMAPFNGEAVYLSLADSERFECEVPTSENTSGVSNIINGSLKFPFINLVARGVDAINNGDFQKVVCARREQVALESGLNELLPKLFSADQSAFRFCFYSSETGLWIGATPEKLLSITDGKLTTMALAGTKPYSDSEPVEWGVKEQDEQQFVTNFIADSLIDLKLEPELSERRTIRAGNIVHLRTDISAQLPQSFNVRSVVEKLHPTPAVCGLPKEAARDFILREEMDREYYSGYLGLLNVSPGDIDLYVNLRSMKIENEVANIFVGCGVTAESNPESEFIETANKSVAMKKILRKQ